MSAKKLSAKSEPFRPRALQAPIVPQQPHLYYPAQIPYPPPNPMMRPDAMFFHHHQQRPYNDFHGDPLTNHQFIPSHYSNTIHNPNLTLKAAQPPRIHRLKHQTEGYSQPPLGVVTLPTAILSPNESPVQIPKQESESLQSESLFESETIPTLNGQPLVQKTESTQITKEPEIITSIKTTSNSDNSTASMATLIQPKDHEEKDVKTDIYMKEKKLHQVKDQIEPLPSTTNTQKDSSVSTKNSIREHNNTVEKSTNKINIRDSTKKLVYGYKEIMDIKDASKQELSEAVLMNIPQELIKIGNNDPISLKCGGVPTSFNERRRMKRDPMSSGSGTVYSNSLLNARSPTRSYDRRGGRDRMRGNRRESGHNSQLSDIKPEDLPELHHAENRYIPTSKEKLDSIEKLLREIRSLLNKLTVDNYDKLLEQVLKLEMTSEILPRIVDVIFEKAVSEAKFGNMYARLCLSLSKELQDRDGKSGAVDEKSLKVQFKKLLQERCRADFESEDINPEDDKDIDEEEREDQLIRQRKRDFGVIQFLGELFLKELLHVHTINYCCGKLLDSTLHRRDDKLEALCKLLEIVGQKYQAKVIKKSAKNDDFLKYFRQVFDALEKLSKDPKSCPRVRFAIMGILELKENEWIPKMRKDHAKTIKEVHEDHKKAETDAVNARKRADIEERRKAELLQKERERKKTKWQPKN